MLSAALGQGLPQYFLDVSGDGRVSAFDAKLVVDHLNWKATQALSASPEGESADALVLGPTTTRSTSSAAAGSDADGDYAQNVDQVLAALAELE